MLSVYTLHRKCFLSFILFITGITPAMLSERHHQMRAIENILSGNKPIVILLNDKKQDTHSNFDDISTGNEDRLEESDDDDGKGTEKNYVAYLLDHLLRTDRTHEPVSSVEDTKQMLRTALRARCIKVEICVKKCPPKQPACPENCRETLDNPNLCSPPPKPSKCKKPKCGKTMPPSWRY